MKAKYAGDCDRCSDPIRRGEDIIFKQVLGMQTMLHPRCASGQDDWTVPVVATKATTTQTKMFVSGFCNANNPADSHKRCKVAAGELVCTCECHTDSAGEEAAPPVPGVPEVEPKLEAADTAPAPRPPTTPLHGFYDDLDEAEYHRHPTSLSQSGAKLILKAPALFDYRRTNPEYKTVWDEGSAAHKLVLGVGPQIYVLPHDDWRTNDAKMQQKVARAEGLIPILPKTWLMVCDMADALTKNTLAMELMSEGKPEVSAFAMHEPTGVLRRSRFDWLGSTILSDYKSAANADPDGFDRVAFNFGYYMQAPWYLDMAQALDHPAAAFAFIVQEKEPPYLVSVCELDADAIKFGRERNLQALERFRDCTESGIWPGYQADGTFSTISLPRYAYSKGLS